MRGQAVLAIWHDIAAGEEAAFHAWHTAEHLPERLAVPGFLRARRYEAVEGAPRFFNDYLVAGPEVLSSPAYLDRLDHPTPWTSRVVPSFRSVNRSVCRVVAEAGRGEGGMLATLRLHDALAAPPERLAALLPGLVAGEEIVAARVLEGDTGASRIETAETRLRAAGTEVASCVIVLEGQFAAPLAAAAGRLATDLRGKGLVAEPPSWGVYRLLLRLEAGA